MAYETLSPEHVAAAQQLAQKLEKHGLLLVAHALLINWRKSVRPDARGFCFYQGSAGGPHPFLMMSGYTLPDPPWLPQEERNAKAV